MTDWKGAFLRKHVVSVEYSEERPEEAPGQVQSSPHGYFIVTFGPGGETEHAFGTYYYPAKKSEVVDFKAGRLSVTRFYGW